ncbi:MAG TPA: hypothetical protein VK932_09655 [Kofleriaceae bacterium]|nr:hypothetical protein [Kofleriaceae bacterium]
MRALLLLLAVAACASQPRREPAEPAEPSEPSDAPPSPREPRRPGEPPRPDDPLRLYVELTIERAHKQSLRDGATAGLARIPFVALRRAHEAADVELQVEAARVVVVGYETVCDIKILILRLPQQDLLGMAEGSARARGTHPRAASECITSLGESLISGKVRTLLLMRLDEKR